MESSRSAVSQERAGPSRGDGSIELGMLLFAMACDVWRPATEEPDDAPSTT